MKKTVLFPFFTRVSPEKFEVWLEGMEKDGWHIDKLTQWNAFGITFKKETSRQYRYCYDMQFTARADYMQTFRDFGWEYVGQVASSRIWRKEYTGKRPDAFTDRETNDARVRRFGNSVMISVALSWILGIGLLYPVFFASAGLPDNDRLQLILCSIFCFALGFGLFSAHLRIRKDLNK
ncbi:MAG: DUF2812 domain-containing protein [Chitinophagales bacterium]